MISEILIIFSLAFIMEIMDSSLGMGYGTILSPTLIILMGYSPSIVIPSIFFSQAFAGSLAAFFHSKHKNVMFKFKEYSWVENLKKGFTQDFKIVLLTSLLGIFITVMAVFFTIHIPVQILKTYIGILVLIIGIFLLQEKQFKFGWHKMILISIAATFNKGFTGGGFGPILTGGQMLGGQEEKSAIGCTTLSQGPVCLTGFITYIVINNIPSKIFMIIIPMFLGATLASPLGSRITKRISREKVKFTTSLLMITIGIWTLTKLWILRS